MATTTDNPCGLMDELIHRIGSQKSTLRELDSLLKSNAVDRLRQDRLGELQTLQRRIESQVNTLQAHESSSACSQAQANIIGGAAGLIFGSLSASIHGAKKPIYGGIRLSQQALQRKSPSGTVMVAIGGAPIKVETVSISQKARDLAITEVGALTSLRAKGYYVVNVHHFDQMVNEIRTGLITGAIPVTIEIEEQTFRCAAALEP